MNRVLLRKLRRDLLGRKGALAALLLIVSIGVGSYTSMVAVHRDLTVARDVYYADRRVADFSVVLKRAPQWLERRVARFRGVESARGRVVIDARVRLADDPRPLPGRAISMPVPRQPVLNDVQLCSGTWFTDARAGEVILNDAFAEARGLRPGDRIRVLLLDREHDLLVVGTAMSPEFVYLLPPGGGLAPDPAHFGVMYLPTTFLQEASDLDGAFNEVIGRAHARDSRSLALTLDTIERELDAYGVVSTIPWFDQPSLRFLEDELKGLGTSSRVMPLIFLAVAALVLNVLIGRLVEQQRTVIGTLKALGYGRLAIARHYVSYGVVIGLAGGLAGVALGYWMQLGLTKLYSDLYKVPGIRARIYVDLFAAALTISVAFAVAGTIKGLLHASKLAPADAMRPPAPEAGSKVFLERIGLLWRWLSFRWKLILRTVIRNRFRTAVTLLGSTIATSLLVAALNLSVALDFMIEHEFAKAAHEDVRIGLRDPRAIEAVSEVASLVDVTGVEPQLAVPGDLSHGPRKKRLGITGLPRGGRLATPLGADDQPVSIPERGLVLTRKLAEILDARPGDRLTFRPLRGRRDPVQTPVTGIVDTYLGLSAYADLDYLGRLIGEERVADTMLVTTASHRASLPLLEELERRPSVLGLGERMRSFEAIDESFGETMGIMIGILVLFAGAIAFGSVLNAALVSISERQREVGTLRVLGWSTPQVAWIFAGESLLLNGIGIAIGVAGGVGLTHALSAAYSTELYRFPAVIETRLLVLSPLIMLFFVGLAQVSTYRILRRLPWMDSLTVRQ